MCHFETIFSVTYIQSVGLDLGSRSRTAGVASVLFVTSDLPACEVETALPEIEIISIKSRLLVTDTACLKQSLLCAIQSVLIHSQELFCILNRFPERLYAGYVFKNSTFLQAPLNCAGGEKGVYLTHLWGGGLQRVVII